MPRPEVYMRKEIELIREAMRAEGLGALIIPTADYHNSEYVNPHFAFRAWATGFTGSAGTAVITMDRTLLWVDGRYYLQAEKQLAGSGVEMVRASEPGALKITDFIKKQLPADVKIGLDKRTVGVAQGKSYANAAGSEGRLCHCDIASKVWRDRPALDPAPVSILEEKYCGESISRKLARIREKMEKTGAQVFVLSSLSEIAWTLNLRGSDVAYCPVFYSYLIITADDARLFAYGSAFSDEICGYLGSAGVTLHPYDSFFDCLGSLAAGRRVLADPQQVSMAVAECIGTAKGESLPLQNPTTLMAAVKNDTEAGNLRKANLADGAAMVRTLYWLKKQVAEGRRISELSVSDYVLRCRLDAGALGASFETIAAYGPHAAIVHYEPTPESDVPVEARGFLLLDCGGHYLNGTTDITRTIAVGPLTDEERRHFTLVLRGTIELAMAVFPEKTSGANLDILARRALWEEGLDYRHGTGHGIGYLLNVHEGPQNIRMNGRAEFVPGMVTSDEPGYYEAGKHGIRIENDTLCVPAFESVYGKFYKFETLTLCPIEREAVVTEMLTPAELKWLNEYHSTVCERLTPLLPEAEAAWLREVTRPL